MAQTFRRSEILGIAQSEGRVPVDDLARRPRLDAIDAARSLALLGMAIFHLTYDLALFGFIPPDTPASPFWANFARAVAGSFLFLVGVGLWMAHGDGIRWWGFVRRLATIAAAAALVTLVTWLAMPEHFIFFGILHSIAVASLLGLSVLRLPSWALVSLAAGVFALPLVFRSEVFAAPGLVWLGFAPVPPPTLDFEPVFPWFAPCLLGIVAGRIIARPEIAGRLAGLRLTGWGGRLLLWPGRHSLLVYLVHQPVLVGLVSVARMVAG